MRDRVSLYPGRVKLTPVAGQENTFDLVRADQPTQEGTPLNKATLLKDVTASILGFPDTAVPDDVFLALIIGVGTYGYRIKIQLADGSPVEGATVSGLEALTGSTLVSGADGIVLGKSTSQTVTIECTSPYIDQAAPASQSITATGTITDVTLTLSAITDMITVTSSKISKISHMAKTVDICLVGGGGGGGGCSTDRYTNGSGGGGGYVQTYLSRVLANNNIQIIIGGGGGGGSQKSDGGDGGATQIIIQNNETMIANGGKAGLAASKYNSDVLGGVGNGNGGGTYYASGLGQYDQLPGGNGSGYIFNEISLGYAGGGGGGAGYSGGRATEYHNPGGSPYGGYGAYVDGTNSAETSRAASSGTGAGAGGGGGCYTRSGAKGGDGCAYFRFHLS